MADSKLSALTATTTLIDTDEFYVNDGGTSKKITKASLDDAISIALSQVNDVTATAAEVNKLDGVTATTAEINKLAGLTATTAELNQIAGVTLSGNNTGDEVSATTTVEGIVEKSTSAENTAGTSDLVYPSVAGVKEMIDTHALVAGGGNVGQTEIKTATASQSASVPASGEYTFTLTGGSYTMGWFVGGSTYSGTLTYGETHNGTYATDVVVSNSNGSSARTAYLYSRYFQASPPYQLGNITDWGHFLYILRNTSTGEILGSYEAPDPMWAYHGDIWLPKNDENRIASYPHPFKEYSERNPADDGLEIVLVDMRDFNMDQWKVDAIKRKKNSPLEEIDLIVKPSGKDKHYKNDYGLKDIPGFTDKIKFKTRQ